MTYFDKIITLAELARVQARRFSDVKALRFRDKTLTYSQLHTQSNCVANALLAQGIKAQSRVALLAKDSLKSFEILFACSKINAVMVPINWRLAAPEVCHILTDANVEVLFVGPEFYKLVKSIENQLDGIKCIIALEKNEQEWLNYDNLCQHYNDVDPNIPVESNDVAVQIYTSGTTGKPKGVQLAHKSFFAIFKEIAKQGETWINWNERDRSLLTLPLFHVGGLWWGIYGLIFGAENILLASFIASDVLETIEKYKITKVSMVPAMMQILLAEPGCDQTDFSSLQYIVYGGAPISQSLLKEARDTFSCNFVQVYGLTETGAIAVTLSADDHNCASLHKLKSAGKPFPGVSLAIVNHEGETLPSGQVGEICIKSLTNMIGYWKLPETTAKTLIDGWVHTGDAGYLDEEGYLYLCDRVKDMVCYAGENVYPAEIENILYEHPAVAEVAVIGVPDPRWGEAVKAVIVPKPGMSLTARDAIDFTRGKLADFKIPKSVEFAESLPRTPSGKVQKDKLREKYCQSNKMLVKA
ncbi:fatty acid--CoA ligase [Scytonema sp. NUACC21]